jgi:hypothetical protein
MKFWFTLAIAVPALMACSKVTSIPLNPDGTENTHDQVQGIRYYLPKPYLLITELPAIPAMSDGSSPQPTDGHGADREIMRDSAPAPKDTQQQTTGKDQPQSSTPTAPATDTSFTASMAQYAVKLVYLPDYSHPMALQMRSGLFGTVSMAPTLQDGWMLTSMNGSNDSGGVAALQAIASLVGGAIGAGATGGAKAAAPKPGARTTAVTPREEEYPPRDKNFEKYGEKIGQGTVRPPTQVELGATESKSLAQLITGIIKGAYARAANAPLPWGDNVLPAGLYAFDYQPSDGGVLNGLKPLVYFCKDGLSKPADGKTPCEHDKVEGRGSR